MSIACLSPLGAILSAVAAAIYLVLSHHVG